MGDGSVSFIVGAKNPKKLEMLKVKFGKLEH